MIDALEGAQLRIFRDVWLESQADYWDRRAEQLAFGLPRPGDFTGQATPDQIHARAERLRAEIAACREHAQVLRCEVSERVQLEGVAA